MTELSRRAFLGSATAASLLELRGASVGQADLHFAKATNETELFDALAALAPEGGTILIDGDLEISQPVLLQAGQRLVGYGSGIPVANQNPRPPLDGIRKVPSGIKPAPGVTLDWVVEIVGPESGKQIWAASLQDLSIDNPAGGGVLIRNAKDILIRDCGISRCGAGVKLVGPRCYNINLFNNIMQANREHAVWIALDDTGKAADKVHVVGGDYQSHKGPSVFRVDGGQCHVFRDFQTGVNLTQAQGGAQFVVFALAGNAFGIVIDTVYSENIRQPIVAVQEGADVGSLVIQNLVVHGVLPDCPAVLALAGARYVYITGGYVRKWDPDTPTITGGTDVDVRGLPTVAGSG